jgi:hypothetical protein
MKYTIEPSSRAAKKYMVKSSDGKVIHFGGAGYDDYTTHKDEKRKARYLSRTASQPQNDITSAAFWARWVLWNEPTIKESIKDIEKKYGINITIRRT